MTQVPNKHSMNLKESVEKSLRKKTFEFESENESSYSMSAYSEMYYI